MTPPRVGRGKMMLGWHWLAEDQRLRFGTKEVVKAGETYTAEGPLRMCRNGMHASRRAIDALEYAPGPVICRVRLYGEIQHDIDKSVARHRTVLWMADATAILHEFALVCGEAALGQWWLRGEATDQELATAWTTAWTTARAAARVAARDAAWTTARAAQNMILELMLESLR